MFFFQRNGPVKSSVHCHDYRCSLQEQWFIQREVPWFCWFGFAAGAKVQHWKQLLGQKRELSEALDFVA